MIAGSTVKAGASAISIQGHLISVDAAASKIVVAGQSLAIPSLSADTKGRFVGSKADPSATSTPRHATQVVEPLDFININGQAITRGGGSITMSKTPVGFNSDGNLVVGTSTVHNFDQPSSQDQLPPVITVGIITLTLGGGANHVKGSMGGDAPTSKHRHAITESGITMSYIDGSSRAESLTIVSSQASVTTNKATAQQASTLFPPSDIAINGMTLAVDDGSPTTVAGLPVSLATNGLLVIGASTIVPRSSQLSPDKADIVTINDQSYTVSPGLPEVVIITGTMTDSDTSPTGIGSPSTTCRPKDNTAEFKFDNSALTVEPTSISLQSSGEIRGSATSTSGTAAASLIPGKKIPIVLFLILLFSSYFIMT